MTYNEWRDELKQNLLCVSESERRRVLDYYAEAYADRRDAGFSEREIIEDFGAPYDAAQRILADNAKDAAADESGAREEAYENNQSRRERKKQERADRKARREEARTPPRRNAPPPPPDYGADAYYESARGDYTWVFVLLCVIFAFPLFGLIMGMVGITIGLCTAPIAAIAAGAGATAGSFWFMASGNVAYGCYMLGCGLAALGAGIMLCPLFFKLVKLMWKLFGWIFRQLKQIFSGRKERIYYERRY